MGNLLIKGDKIDGLFFLLRQRLLNGEINLVYIDPPFAIGNDFIISGNHASAVNRTKKGQIAYSDKMFLDELLVFLRQRLLLLRELMSEQASIYVHVDCKIGHYVKVLLDDVFGIENFRNDIARTKCNPKNFRRVGFGNIKDMILFCTKSKHAVWNEPIERYTATYIQKLFRKVDQNGWRYTTVALHAPGEVANDKCDQHFRGVYPPKGRHWCTDIETLEKWGRDGLIEWSSTGNPRKIVYVDERKGSEFKMCGILKTRLVRRIRQKKLRDAKFDYSDFFESR